MTTKTLLEDIRDAISQDRLPLGVFNNPELFELEQRLVFSRSWHFLGHESEISKPGDYVVRYIVNDCFIVVRGHDGEVRVLLNACRHRGRQLTRAEAGNVPSFTCPYHGWVYRNDGDLHTIQLSDAIFGEGGIDKRTLGLRPAPQFSVWRGWIFACLSAETMPLEAYLGDATWYLDFYTNKTPGGLEVRGGPQRWIIEADWKLAADNFVGDGYHTAITHASTVTAGILPVQSGNFLFDGVQVALEHFGVGFARQDPLFNSLAYPPSILQSLRERLNSAQVELLDSGVSLPTHANLFPNLSFLNAPGAYASDRPPAPYLTLRTWRPVAAGRTEVWSWFLVESDAPEEFKDASYQAYILSFGSAGTLEQDDAENWSTITSAAAGQFARKMLLDYSMGRQVLDPMPDWPGPGPAYPLDFTEFAQRAFWRKWLLMLEDA